jgi:hypothetical protein
MGGYQGFNENIPFPRTSTVPTPLQRLGDFPRHVQLGLRVLF